MKKFLSIFCLLAVLISMIACNQQTGTPETSQPNESETTPVGSDNLTESGTDTAVTEPPAVADTEVVYFTVPAIKAENGKKTDLSVYSVQFTKTTTTPSSDITWSSDEIEIAEGRYVTPSKSGVYKLTATAKNKTKKVYLVSKAANEDEYVLYYNDFGADMDGLSVIQKTSATVSVSGGELILDASSATSAYARVLLPAFLGDFGDYKITAVGTMTAAKNTKRWMSVMWRVQSSNFPYYQLAVRQDATLSNGIELAERTAADAWNVRHTGSFNQKIAASTKYTFMADVHGNYAAAYINGKKITEGTDFDGYRTGRIGFQANGCKAMFDSVKVVLSDADPLPYPVELADVKELKTNIINSAAVIKEIKSAEDIESLKNAEITTVLMHVDPSLNVIDESGKSIGRLSSLMADIHSKYIAVIYPKDAESLAPILSYIKSNNFTDVSIMSDKKEILNKVYKDAPGIGRIFDLRTLKPEKDIYKQLEQIREQGNAANARICVLSDEFANKRYVEYLNRRATTVWIDCTSGDIAGAVNTITSGANGILAADTNIVANAMASEIFAKNSVVRPVQVIGHRGIPSKAPENTIEGSSLAIKNGATIVENDIYLTKDGVLVVMHDGTIDRTTNGTGTVTAMTYTELSKYYVDTHAGINAKIPTLEDYFKEYKGQDVVIYIEIKDSNLALVPALKKLIDQYDFMDQAAVITFKLNMFKAIREQIPGLSCGFLTSSITAPETLMPEINGYDATFNPNNSKITLALARQMMLRGITVWPWTVNDKNTYDKCFLAGVSGVTTNYSDYSAEYLKFLDADMSEYSFKAGEKASISFTAENYLRQTLKPTAVELVIVSGNDTVKYENGSLTATKSGSASVMFRYSYRLNDGTSVSIYTQIIDVDVK